MIDSPGPGQNRISGTSGGIPFESVTFFDVISFTIDTGTNDQPGDDADFITIDTDGEVASGLQNLTINIGEGSNEVFINVADFVLWQGGTLTINAGFGIDDHIMVVGTDYDDIFDISGDGISFYSTAVAPIGVELLTVEGSGGDDTFKVVASAETEIAVDGGDGYDRLLVDTQGASATFFENGVVVDGMLPVTCSLETEEFEVVPGVREFSLERVIDYEAPGTALDDGYEYGVEVAGLWMLNVTITTPWGQTVSVEDFVPPDWVFGDYLEVSRGPVQFESYMGWDGFPRVEFWWSWLSQSQWESLDTGLTDIEVTLQAGVFAASLSFAEVTVPDREPNPVSPVHRELEEANLTAEWPAWTSAGVNASISVDLEECFPYDQWRWHGGEDLPSSATSWTPNTLPAGGGVYEFAIEFVDAAHRNEGGVVIETAAATENDVYFVVGGPESTIRVHPETGHVYFLTDYGNWYDCQATAELHGGNLVTINDATEEQWLRQEYGTEQQYWIGYNDIAQEGSWEWAGGESPTYTNWAPWQPDNWGGNEDAAALNSNAEGQWNDLPTDAYWPGIRGIVELPAGSMPDLADDHGNTADSATALTAPTSINGRLSYWGDIDFFSFEATAGQTYDILVGLPEQGLDDSMLWLYDTDGETLLGRDDDSGHDWGSRLIWTAPVTGTYIIAVDARQLWEDSLGAYTLQIADSILTPDVPDHTFTHGGLWLLAQGDIGVGLSVRYSGSTSEEDPVILHRIDLSDPTAPVELGTTFVGGVEGVAFGTGGDRFYVADDTGAWSTPGSGHSEIVVFDVSGAGDPVELYRIPTQQLDVDSLAVSGSYLYVATQPEDESQAFLEIYAISDAMGPVFIGQSDAITSPSPGLVYFDPEDMVVSGGFAYILHEEPGLLSIMDVTDPRDPILVGQYELEAAPTFSSMAVSGETLWVETGWQLRAIDVSDPVHPQELAVLDMDGQVGQILPRGERAYVGLAAIGAAVLDISDASNPQVLNQYEVGCTTGLAATSGKYLLIPTGTQISIFDADIAPYVTSYQPTGIVAPPVASIEFTFDRRMDPASFSPADDIASFTGPEGALTATGYNWMDNYTLQVSFDSQTAMGAYEMVIGPDILDMDGIALDQDGDGTPGELLDDRVAAQFTIEQVCQVFVVRCIDYEAPGSALDDEFEYHVGALGATIINTVVTTPWGETLNSADHLPPAWSGEHVFKVVGNLELEAGTEDGNRWMSASWDLDPQQWEALDTADTQIQVFYPGGIWTGSVNFSPVDQPVQEPTLTDPIHDQTGVPLRPTIQWEEWTSATANSQVEVRLIDVTAKEDLCREFLGSDVVSWGVPETLQPEYRYEFELNFQNYATVVVNGIGVDVVAQTASDTQFTTAVSGLGDVRIFRGIDYEISGRPEDDAYTFDIELLGAGITETEVTTPWGQIYKLSQLLPQDWNGQDYVRVRRGAFEFEVYMQNGLTCYRFNWNWLSESQWASLDTGQTHISVDYGDNQNWQADLDFAGVIQPQREPNPTSPIHREIEPGDLTVEWALWENPPEDGIIHIRLEEETHPWYGGGDLEEDVLLPASTTSWGPLSLPSSIYELQLDFGQINDKVIGGVPVQTIAYTESDVFFLAGPEVSLRTEPVSGITFFLTPPGSWNFCQSYAEHWGGNLATINSAGQEAWLRQQYGTDESYWIGFNDIAEEGVWEWVNGDPITYENWAPGEPNDYLGEDAAVMNSNAAGQWNDLPPDSYCRGLAMVPAGVPVVPQEDHANTYNQATHLNVPITAAGQLSYVSDIDFFSFDATAGQTYEILIDLPVQGLRDSTAWLYDTDGRTLLSWDDDGGHGWGSRIIWTAPADGTYYLAVDAYELWDDDIGAYSVQISLSGLTADTPAETFTYPAEFLVARGNRGVAVSMTYTGATSADADAILHLLDFSDPLAPIELGGYFTGDIEGVAFDNANQFCYLADDSSAWDLQGLGHSEIVVLDVSGLGDPIEVTRLSIQQFDVDSIALAGSYLYVGSQPQDNSQAFLEIYDISDPAAPVFSGQTGPIFWPGQNWGFDPEAVAVSDGRAYILHEEPQLVSIVDVTDPTAPQLLNQYELPGAPTGNWWSIGVAGDTLLAGCGWQLHSIDVSDPTAPQGLAALDMGGQVGEILVRGERAYVGVIALGAAIVDISTPSQPQVLEQYVVNGATGSVAISASYLCIPTGTQISIFDAGIGPYVTCYQPSGILYPPVASIEFIFDRPMDDTSFSLAEDIVSFTGPGGALAATGHSWIDEYTLQVSFVPQTAIGSYEMVIGPDILDLDGFALDQDGDGILGEPQDDSLAAGFTIEKICDVFLWRSIDYEAPGTALDDEYEYGVEVAGLRIINFEVTTPWDETVSSGDYLPTNWSGEYVRQEVGNLVFEAGTEDGRRWISVAWEQLDQSQWSALDSIATQIVVAYPGGTWTGTVDFAQVEQPTQEPTLTDPIHEQTGVPLRPTIQWQGWTSIPAGGQVEVFLQDVTADEELCEQVLVSDAVSWQVPQTLQPDHQYEVELDFEDFAIVTVNGVDVYVSAEVESDTQFTSAASGLGEIWIERDIDYEVPGRPEDDAYEYGIEFCGAGITNIEITTPWGQVCGLGQLLPPDWNGQDYVEVQRGAIVFEVYRDGELTCYEFGWEWLSDSQWASLDTGQTHVSVDYGDNQNWQADLDFAAVTQPLREPKPVSPAHRQVESGNLIVEWALWADAPEGGIIHINLDEEVPYWAGAVGLDVEVELPASATSWGPLSLPASIYELEVDFGKINQEKINDVSICTVTYTENDVTFLTGPETSLVTEPASGNRYFLTPYGNWQDCQGFAEYWGGDLVTIASAEQEAWLHQQYGTDEPFWIGFNDIAQEGVWEWVSGDPVTYTNWAPSQPDNWGGNEDAAVMSLFSPGRWNDDRVDSYYRGIAMVPAGVPVVPCRCR
jgi:hypothetical protein